MRAHLHGDNTVLKFSQQLLTLGNGLANVNPKNGLISFDADFCIIVKSMQELMDKVFPNIHSHISDHKWLCERAILAPKMTV
jgi:acetone carboxylase gamma subunit